MVSGYGQDGAGGSEGEGGRASAVDDAADPDAPAAPATARDRDWARRAALAYLERYASSEANLVRVLKRKIRRRVEATGRPIADPDAMVGEAVAACRTLGLVDDTAFAETKVAAGRRKGLSRSRLMATLAVKGVDRETAAAAVAEDAPDDLVAALRFARRKRLGPWRTPGRADGDPARASREIAALCRAGHAYGISRTVVGLDREAAEEALEAAE